MKTPRLSHSILFGTISTLLAATLPVGAVSSTSPGAFVYLLTQSGGLATATTGNFSTPSAAVAITGVTAGETLVAIDVRPQNQELYALGVNATTDTATLYHVSAQTAVATAVGTSGSIAFVDAAASPVDFADPATVGWDIDFNPAVDRVRVVAANGLTFRINPNNGAAFDGDNGGAAAAVAGVNTDGPISGGTTTVSGAAYTNNKPNNGSITTLYTVDAATNALFIQNPPNAGTQASGVTLTLGGNPLDISKVGGFDILPGVNTASSNAAVSSGSALLEATVSGVESLYSVDLVTGACTQLGATPLAVRGFAVRPNVGAAVIVGPNQKELLRFDPATPGTTTGVQLTGVRSGELIVGIDSRPQTGQLMGLGINDTGNTGTLYLIDPQGGATTVIGSLGGIAFVDAAGSPVVFTDPGLTGYGFDFNPTVDRIRVIGTNGLNFRINPNTGAPVDGDAVLTGINPDGVQTGLSNGSLGAEAAAYTNSFGQSLTGGVTTLYTLDASSNGLYIQNPPNLGVQNFQAVVTLGGSPLNITSFGGFDIPGTVAVSASNAPAVGDGFLAIGGTLYRINLTSGAATSLGTIGAGSGVGGLVVWSVPSPEIAVTGNSTEIADGDVTPSATDDTDFGTVGALDAPVSRTFTIINSGTAPLSLSGAITSTNPAFTVTQPSASNVAENGGTATFSITYRPTASGLQTSSISIANDDPDEGTYNFNVSATGDTAPIVLAETRVQIAGEPMGTVFGKLTTAGDSADAKAVLGKLTLPTGKKVDGIVRGGTSILKVGDALAVAGGATVAKLYAMSNGAFLATLKPGTGSPKATGATSNVVLYENTGNLSLIARSGSGPGAFKSFGACAATDAGDVFFTTSTGLYVQPAAGMLTPLVTKGQTINLGNGDKKVTVISAMPSIKGSLAEGRVFLGGTGLLARITMGKDHAIVAIPPTASSPSAWTIIARTGDTAPGMVGAYATLGLPAADDAVVAFQATLAPDIVLSNYKYNDTIIVSGGQLIAREGWGAAGAPGAYSKLSDPAVGSGGRVSFTATLVGVPAAKKTGLWQYNGANLELIARVGDPAPGISGGVTLGAITSFAQPGGGLGPVFTGTVKGTGVNRANNAALWAVPASSSTVRLIVRTGDKFTIGAVATERTLKSFKALQLDLGTEGTARGYTDKSVLILGTFTDKSEIALEFPILGGMGM